MIAGPATSGGWRDVTADEIEGGSDTPTQYNGQGCRLGNTSDDDDDNGDYDGDDGGDDDDDDDSFVLFVCYNSSTL